MVKTPLCGISEGITDNTVTIFVGTGTCFGSVVLFNFGTGAVEVLKNGLTTPLATIEPNSRLALALDSLFELELRFVADSIISYKGCICCNDNPCCPTSCET